ncbi:lysophospholipid acyltransferase family protein [Dellaglioa algida]|uniref:1-acyl-sn-glycerol-3-phosphate acyltransferase n=2 Tax=Dellaglioa algida TaxID=105612 RepID=A0A0R1HKF8_9LACO|nr:1-acyl-sn-glycerol-3-phosphate acyltransferase [Dellaglioa algida]KRK46696.1 1-acyl-sn-glycerol-3-phosphate acyltransferase [Dellaglioa algida DSM 15638]MDK1716436.1 1-acyl-sn-glycerol-3-phosphate acyltransferase [Dellaglioa algida]MDK1718141.1 1-acyl-sn-glycerol-3-phosphate acyltransferase [Dellaglioa algida]MDK1720071.1 1-acyl-sn-glycerol-3-phosphate acyltransferase [Dellaglioa algida]MDK1721378.1 1-acyl-sn-glycerol-3-phosphate acyltransferase [Dellaglioa algida]
MFYSFARGIVRIIIFLINGNAHYINKEKLPEGSYILVGPHRTWFDPIYFALAGSPKKFSFMAKKELFVNPILRYILIHANAFPVDRENPGPSTIKTPVKFLKKGDLSLIMFPSGTRHSEELKGGSLLIARMAQVPLVPAVYQGPLTFKQLFSRKRITVSFGDPIYLDRKTKLTDEVQAQMDTKLTDAFKQLDMEINPDFKYVDPHKK